MKEIGIYGVGAVSAAGVGSDPLFESLIDHSKLSSIRSYDGEEIPVFSLPEGSNDELMAFRSESSRLKRSDRVTLLGAYASKAALENSRYKNEKFGLTFGSSRGATSALERFTQDFLTGERLSPSVSPVTTAGGISSTIASVIGATDIAISHSVTCSTGLHSLLNAIQWIRSGEASHFIAGASEAPLTPFTIAQMKALSIYSNGGEFPCRPIEKRASTNTFTLGEGGVALALSEVKDEAPLALIDSYGYAQEFPESPTGISKDGEGFRRSMEMALSRAKNRDIDLLFLHAPGTLDGDASELSAVRAVFGSKVPYLVSTKWCTGHTFSVSGLLSLALGLECMKRDLVPTFPYETEIQAKEPSKIRSMMINSAGFGGNFVSILVRAYS